MDKLEYLKNCNRDELLDIAIRVTERLHKLEAKTKRLELENSTLKKKIEKFLKSIMK